LYGEIAPFGAQFNRVAADLDDGVALNRISFMGEGEWSTINLDEGKTSIRFR